MNSQRVRHQTAKGYALILVMFLLTLLVIALAAATPNLLTENRREREQELIWRGQQYVRGIRLYHQKTNRFPAQLRDLYAPNTGIRFMRKAYKDPMNSADGSWRVIYVGPQGQLIGSLTDNHNAFFFGGSAPSGFAGALSTLGSSSTQNPFSFPSAPKTSSFSSSMNIAAQGAQQQQGFGNSIPPVPAPLDGDSLDQGNNSVAAPIATQTPDDSQLLGQTLIIGVGSKVNRRSVRKYEGATNYLKFEFIWKPSVSATAGTPSP